jgi:spermidine/putrescine transport system ATP-binding protein
MIQDYDPYPVGSEVMLYIDPDDIQVMRKERTRNVLEGTWNGEGIDFDCPEFTLPGDTDAIPEEVRNSLVKGTRVKVEIPFEDIDLLDDIDAGFTSGEVHFILYMGNHYHLTIKTDGGGFLWVDTQDIWDKGDLVGIGFKKERPIKISIIDEKA